MEDGQASTGGMARAFSRQSGVGRLFSGFNLRSDQKEIVHSIGDGLFTADSGSSQLTERRPRDPSCTVSSAQALTLLSRQQSF